ncbi:aldose 1-epimerase [uncultured Polaribacter sp.]|uniref:aldose 1-epimerase n=1 Tax=uncultured Polaribacter sp. TaxID=174711 RepID=UPI002620D570|nr:aldose 1-epimerase [uncultured Polaribacter sp.]
MSSIHFLDEAENHIEIQNKNSRAIINLVNGASLQELVLNKKLIIKDISKNYKVNYASSILFPFPGRIEDGKYTFKDKEYQVPCNDTENNNALHGVVFDKKFEFVSKEHQNEAMVLKLCYQPEKKESSFPFLYKIDLIYTLSATSLTLKMQVTNLDNTNFPFFLGWHPYFESSNLDKSFVDFKSNKQSKLNDRLIAVDVIDKQITAPIHFKHKTFDDCFYLTDTKVKFITPDYKLLINSDAKNAFLQMYTPPDRKRVALEPQTGPSNALHNKTSLTILEPEKNYTVNWSLQLID